MTIVAQASVSIRAALVVASLLTLAACGDDPVIADPTSTENRYRVVISPDSADMMAGDSIHLNANVEVVEFIPGLQPPEVRWEIGDSRGWNEPPEIDGDGWVSGTDAGHGEVIAHLVRSGSRVYGDGAADTAWIEVVSGAPWSVEIVSTLHGIQQGRPYESQQVFGVSVSDSFGNPTSGELHWTSEDLSFEDGMTRGVAAGTVSVAVGVTENAPQDDTTLWVAPFTGTWEDVAVASRPPPYPTEFNSGRSVVCATGGGTFCRGPNDFGQLGYYTPLIWVPLGDGTGRARAYRRSELWLPVDTDLVFESVSNGVSHTCGLGEDGIAYCWGNPRMTANPEGDVCTYGYFQPARPCDFEPRPVREDLQFLQITERCGITAAGDLWCWGEDVRQIFQDTPLRNFDGDDAGGCGLSDQGVPYCWGGNEHGQLGIGSADTLSHPEPEPVATELHFTDITYFDAHACGIAMDGRPYCWGAGGHGQLGTNEVSDLCPPGARDEDSVPCSTTPVQVASQETFQQIEAGSGFTCGLTSSGDGYCWGRELDEDDIPQSHVPHRVPLELPATTVDNGHSSVCFGLEDGEIPCWADPF